MVYRRSVEALYRFSDERATADGQRRYHGMPPECNDASNVSA